jgi:hypothetical protein
VCIAPLQLNDGTEVACHECWQCREQAINDWVGRNIAESRTAKWSRAVTLTYGRSRAGDADHERAVVLTYSDVQKWIKLLRWHGCPVRYFVTGEFGSTKGRAHWHVMLYGSGDMPPHKLDDSFHEGGHWSHGYSFWTKPTDHAVRYNCKYIQKDMGDAERQGHLAMSKKPPLGAVWFANMAERYVEQGLAPQSLAYSFPDVRRRKKDGSEEVVPFRLKDRSAELFLEHYIRTWHERRPGEELPPSELVEHWVEYGVLRVPPEEEGVARHREFLDRARERRDKSGPRNVRPSRFGPPRELEGHELVRAEARSIWRAQRRWDVEDLQQEVPNGQEQQQQDGEEEQRKRNREFEAERERNWREYVRGRGRREAERQRKRK